jgi:serine/threonine protein phosphatase PrpC
MTLALRYAVRSDVGLLREGNEDSAYAGPRLLAVADGMGGHAAGEVASAVTIGAMAELDTDQPAEPDEDMMADLSSAVAAANMRLQQMIMANPAIEGMGTTLTAVLWSDGHAAVCHIGDSRGYLLRDGELYQITHDHTLVQSLVDEGRITEDDVSTHPQRSLLLRALDGRTVAEPDLSVHEAQLGDRYLLCSDGLSGVVSDETLRDTLAGIPDPEAVARQLIDLAIRGGGPDNITCIVADVVDSDLTRPTMTPVMAGAAANGTDPRSQAPGTNPFAALSGAGGGRTGTAPQPMLGEDGMSGGNTVNGVNGSAPAAATATEPARRGHRAGRGRNQGRNQGREGGRRRWPIVTTSLVVLVAVLIGGGYVAYRYTQDQYYVAADKTGQVVIYQGVNQSVAGISLSHPHTYTSIALSQVSTTYRQQLASTPSASSLSGAEQIVSNIRTQVNECDNWYHGLVTWQTAQNNYNAQVAAARRQKKPTKNIHPPGPQPSAPAGIMCPPSTAYGVQPNQIPAGL